MNIAEHQGGECEYDHKPVGHEFFGFAETHGKKDQQEYENNIGDIGAENQV